MKISNNHNLIKIRTLMINKCPIHNPRTCHKYINNINEIIIKIISSILIIIIIKDSENVHLIIITEIIINKDQGRDKILDLKIIIK